jgi:hypothetical protein
MAQLTMMSNRLDLQGATLACHAQRLGNAEGFDASNTSATTQIAAPTGGQGNGSNGGIGGAESSGPRPPQPPHDHRKDLRNSFHQPKIKFPCYDGESDPLPWLNRCESYFRSTRTLQAEQVWLASLHMDGAATKWYYVLEREYSLVPWARFAEFVNLRFEPPLRSNPLDELKELHRARPVEDYQRQFLALLCRCDDLSAVHAMNLFTAGLGEPMTCDVEMQRSADLQAAMSLARAFE